MLSSESRSSPLKPAAAYDDFKPAGYRSLSKSPAKRKNVQSIRASPYAKPLSRKLFVSSATGTDGKREQLPFLEELTVSSGGLRKHKDDNLGFSLFDKVKAEFRIPTAEEKKEIYEKFGATGLVIRPPWLIIRCKEPPSSTPFTVGGMLAVYVEDLDNINMDIGSIGQAPRLVADPLPDLQVGRYKIPTREVRLKVLQTIRDVYQVPVNAITYYYNRWVVELENFPHDYSILPGRVASLNTYYAPAGVWKTVEMTKRQTDAKITPDRNDYRPFGPLHAGVEVATADGSRSSTSGVLLTNSTTNDVALTVSNHSFPNNNAVHHPLGGGAIGEIFERWVRQDIALARPTGVNWTNTEYFEVAPPGRLLRSTDIDIGAWVFFDSWVSGLMTMNVAGIHDELKPEEGMPFTVIQMLNIDSNYVLASPCSARNVTMRDGLCGSPIVLEQDNFGQNVDAVISFFRFASQDSSHAFASVLDDIMDANWALAAI